MKNKLSCIIADDEPFARKGLQGYIEKTSFLQLSGTCSDGLALQAMLLDSKPDLLFLDIEMPYISGIDLLRSLANPPKVIFITAYEQYAVQSYELDVLDYLLKPVSYERFLKSAHKALDYFLVNGANTPPTAVFVKAAGRLEKIVFSELLYVEGMENYLALYTAGRKFIIHSTIKAFLEKLPPQQFMQTHKSYIVAVDKVQSIEGNTLFIADKQIPVSRALLDAVLEKILNRQP